MRHQDSRQELRSGTEALEIKIVKTIPKRTSREGGVCGQQTWFRQEGIHFNRRFGEIPQHWIRDVPQKQRSLDYFQKNQQKEWKNYVRRHPLGHLPLIRGDIFSSLSQYSSFITIFNRLWKRSKRGYLEARQPIFVRIYICQKSIL